MTAFTPSTVPPQRDQTEDTRNQLRREWLQRIAGGDQAALAALHDDTRLQVFAVARRVLEATADAEEVTSDVYLRVWRAAATYDVRRGSVMAWLTTITRTRAIDRWRALRRRPDAVDGRGCSERQGPALDRLRCPAPDPEQALLRRHRRRTVRSAVTRLAAPQRRAIQLAFFADRSHRELAAELRLPLGTVKTRIRSGVHRLTPVLADAV